MPKKDGTNGGGDSPPPQPLPQITVVSNDEAVRQTTTNNTTIEENADIEEVYWMILWYFPIIPRKCHFKINYMDNF